MTTLSDMKDTSAATLQALAARLATGSDGKIDEALRARHLKVFQEAAGLMDQVGYARVSTTPESALALTSRWNSTNPRDQRLIGMSLDVAIPADQRAITAKVAKQGTAEQILAAGGSRSVTLSDPVSREVSTIVGGILNVLGGDGRHSLYEAQFASAVTRVLTASEISRTGTPVQRR